jgi:hypothetical protein
MSQFEELGCPKVERRYVLVRGGFIHGPNLRPGALVVIASGGNGRHALPITLKMVPGCANVKCLDPLPAWTFGADKTSFDAL